MHEGTPEQGQQLTQENERLRAALEEIKAQIEPYLNAERGQAAERPFERQVVHDVRNILNELGLLRALVPNDDAN
jgi:hypothetical protein